MGGNGAWLTPDCGAFVTEAAGGNGDGNALACVAEIRGCAAVFACDGGGFGKARDNGATETRGGCLAVATDGDGSGIVAGRGAAATGGDRVTVGTGGAGLGIVVGAGRTVLFRGTVLVDAVLLDAVAGGFAFAV